MSRALLTWGVPVASLVAALPTAAAEKEKVNDQIMVVHGPEGLQFDTFEIVENTSELDIVDLEQRLDTMYLAQIATCHLTVKPDDSGGESVVTFTVDRAGKAKEVKVTSPPARGLNKCLVKSVARWRFQAPDRKSGAARLRLVFHLYAGEREPMHPPFRTGMMAKVRTPGVTLVLEEVENTSSRELAIVESRVRAAYTAQIDHCVARLYRSDDPGPGAGDEATLLFTVAAAGTLSQVEATGFGETFSHCLAARAVGWKFAKAKDKKKGTMRVKLRVVREKD